MFFVTPVKGVAGRPLRASIFIPDQFDNKRVVPDLEFKFIGSEKLPQHRACPASERKRPPSLATWAAMHCTAFPTSDSCLGAGSEKVPPETTVSRRREFHTRRCGLELEIDGRMVYLWRAVDAEGEVRDVLVQAKRNKRAALKLMCKLLNKYGLVPDKLVTDDLRSYRAAAHDLGISNRHVRDGATTEPRTRINRPADENARCRVLRARVQPRDFSQATQPRTTLSTFNATSSQQERTEPSGNRPCRHGERPSPLTCREICYVL